MIRDGTNEVLVMSVITGPGVFECCEKSGTLSPKEKVSKSVTSVREVLP